MSQDKKNDKQLLKDWLDRTVEIKSSGQAKKDYIEGFLKSLPIPLKEHIDQCEFCLKDVSEFGNRFIDEYVQLIKKIYKHNES